MRHFKLPVLAAVAAVGLMTAGMSARASEINVSVGISVPGAVAVVSNAPMAGHRAPVGVPVAVYPAPVVVQPAPVMAYPAPVAVHRPVIVAAPTVHVVPAPAMYAPPVRTVSYVSGPDWDHRHKVRYVKRHRHFHGEVAHRHGRDRDGHDHRWSRGHQGHDDDRGHRHGSH